MEKTITQYLDHEYTNYAMYVIESRALSSVIDGLKPTQRKIIYVANKTWRTGTEKPMKIFQLGGRIANEAFYHHGDCLSEDTTIRLIDGSDISIKDWIDNYNSKDLSILSYNEDLNVYEEDTAFNPRLGQLTTLEYEIELENGEIVKCTKNHPFLLKNGLWKYAYELTTEDELKSMDNE